MMRQVQKVLLLIENCSVPMDSRVWAEALTLRERGFQVSIIGPKGTNLDQESYVYLDGVHIYRYWSPPNSSNATAYVFEYGVAMVRTFLLSLKVLLRHGFDVIHVANPPDTYFVIGLFYRLLGKKFIFDQHDLSPELFQTKFSDRMPFLHRPLLFVERCSYRIAAVVITSNTTMKEFAIKRGHVCANKVFAVYNGVDLNRINRVTPEPALKHGRRFLLAFVGAMEVQDGVEYLLLALHTLVHERGRRDVSLVLMGDGDHAPVLRKLASELRLDEYVHFKGWTQAKDVARFLSAADVGLVPEPQNGLNEYCTLGKTLEYMAVSKPSVAFDLPETRRVAGDAALYARPNSAEDFADKIEILLNDEALREQMGAVGRKRIDEEFSWDHTKTELLRAYEALVSEKL
ncbi:MAG TPA: glycosyltransferase family 4 protein [Ktedonobacterales bacterium]|nr:glycosyltransferase family 4 protein [Ktedonobacterales bacterium]